MRKLGMSCALPAALLAAKAVEPRKPYGDLTPRLMRRCAPAPRRQAQPAGLTMTMEKY
jgi:hypothetical protein